MASPRAFMAFATVVAFLTDLDLVMGTNFTVGGPSGGWNLNTNLQAWASTKSFSPGDILIFSYNPSYHNVMEVSQGDYASCETGSPMKTYTGGNTVITLSSPGTRYFICGTTGHCGKGMKIEIIATAGGSPPQSSPSTPPPPPSGAPATNSRSLEPMLAIGIGLGMLMSLFF